MPWITLDEVKDHLEIPQSDTASDAELASVLLQATEWVTRRVGPVTPTTVTETVPAGASLVLSRTPVISVTSVVGANGYTGTYDPAYLYVNGAAGIVSGYAGTRFATAVSVTYVVGTADPPEAWRGAALEIVRALWSPQRGGAQAAAALATGIGDDGAPSEGNLGLAQYRAEQLLGAVPPTFA